MFPVGRGCHLAAINMISIVLENYLKAPINYRPIFQRTMIQYVVK